MKNKIDDILSQRAKSPTPHLQPDPFLPTRIRATVIDKNELGKISKLVYNWSVASLVTSGAILIGIYLGSGLVEEEYSSDMITDFSSVIYQSDYTENLDSVIEDGGAE